MRSRVEVHLPDGNIAVLVDWMNLRDEDWTTRLLPLAELVHAAHPAAEWVAVPMPEQMSDKEAMTGHVS